MHHCELCVIGASTGGPPALQRILEQLPARFPLPIVVVQHMPPSFTDAFAKRLDALCRLRVTEAAEGMRLSPGQVVVAPGGRHLRISSAVRGAAHPKYRRHHALGRALEARACARRSAHGNGGGWGGRHGHDPRRRGPDDRGE